MKTKTIHIFLAGGGSVADSRLLDERFVESLDCMKRLVYIPNAMKSRPYQLCFEWFRSAMTSLGFTNIEMWNDLRPLCSVDSIAGIYMGGGDSVKLLKELRVSGFSDYLLEAVDAGVPIYGGSAGAVILGKDIRTAPEAKNFSTSETIGLKIVSDYSIVCHYNATEETLVQQLVQAFDCNIIAIPEKAGGYFSENVLVNYGTESISIFQKNKIVHLEPNHSIQLFLRR